MASTQSNLAWAIPAKASSIAHLEQQSHPIPSVGPHQVLVRLTAAALNYRDLLVAIRSPEYPGIEKLPGNHKPNLIPCSDGAGVIHTVGPSSKWSAREGIKVLLHPSEWGLLQQWIAVDDEQVVEVPKHLSSAESATLSTAGVTAWSAIRESFDAFLTGELREWKEGRRLEGQTILTQGTGGVSCFAIQIAAALGATVIATSSSDTKLELAKQLGATHGINYKTHPDWDQEVQRLTNGKGVDQVIEVGGARTLLKSVNSVRPGGLVNLIGILSAPQDLPSELVPSILFGGKIVKGCLAFNRDATAEFARFAEQHNIKPVIAKEFDFDDAVKAFEALQNQSEVGKIVIKIADE